jgi:hypothetical protein
MRFQENKLTPYRRHQPACEFRRPTQLDCQCPLWAHGRLKGVRYRRSLGTRSLAKAQKKIQRLLDGTEEALAEAERARAAARTPTISQAIADHLEFLERNLRRKRSTLISYQGTFKAFADFADERLFRTVDGRRHRRRGPAFTGLSRAPTSYRSSTVEIPQKYPYSTVAILLILKDLAVDNRPSLVYPFWRISQVILFMKFDRKSGGMPC